MTYFPVQTAILWTDTRSCNDAPGLGIEIDMDVAESSRSRPTRLAANPQTQRRSTNQLVNATHLPLLGEMSEGRKGGQP